MIPTQLESWRFILIVPSQKIPVAEMKGWAKNREQQTYPYNSSTLQTHLNNGGNYGVVADKDRFIVAADTKEIEQAIETRLPVTFSVKSARHQTKHFYFYGHIENTIQTKPTAQGDPCADIKYGNSYVLGPGSKFENYGNYEVADNFPIATITEDQLIAAINEFIINKKIINEPTETQISNPELNFPITQLITDINGLSYNGNEIFGPHPTHGSTTGSNFHVNTIKNVWHCFRAGHDSGGGPLELLAVMEGIIPCENAQKGALRGETFYKIVNKAIEKGYLKEIPKNLEPREFTTLKIEGNKAFQIPNIEKILDYFNEKYVFKTSNDTEDIYAYNNGVYELAEIKLKGEIEALLKSLANTHLVNEILNHIKRQSYTERTEFNQREDYLPCQNGLLNLETLELENFTPQKIFTFKINTFYDNTKTCPIFEDFLTQILDKTNIQCIQEQCGYCLQPTMSFHKIFLWYGSGRNGKGVLARTLIAVLGPENVSNLTLEQLSGSNRFAIAGLYGKLVNFSSEPIISQKILTTATLKKITGQDRLDAEIKNKQKPLQFTNFAKIVIQGNQYPKVEDNTPAFWERVLMTPFENMFLEGINQTQDLEKTWIQDSNEMSGILNWMLQGLKNLRTNKKFSVSKEQEAKKLEFERTANPIIAFFLEKTDKASDNTIERTTLYNEYKKYSDEELGVAPVSDRIFYNKVRELPYVLDTWRGANTRAFKGIKIKTISKTPENQTELPHEPQLPHEVTTPKLYTQNIPPVPHSKIGVVSVVSVVDNDKLIVSCPGCLKPVPLDRFDCTTFEGHDWHIPCYRKLIDGRQNKE